VTESRSDAPETISDASADADGPAARAEWATALGEALGAVEVSTDFDTVRIVVDRSAWTDVIAAARDQHDLVFFSWLSAVDWSREVRVGDPVADVEGLDERYEVICRLSSITSANGAHFIARLPKDDATIDSLVPLFGGAAWHEREAAEMFGIDFTGHPGLDPLYLPDAFEGHPLRKSFPLLSREVKPWPGMVDVEAMPSTENVEAGEAAPSGEET
jgi:NADH-quinone oxidoreductase subunit C